VTAKKKLMEVALPLAAINKACVRDRAIRHGHPRRSASREDTPATAGSAAVPARSSSTATCETRRAPARPKAKLQQVLPGQSRAQIKRLPDARLRVIPAVEARLNERQRKMLELLVPGDELTSRKCETMFSVRRDTANRDFSLLMDMGLLRKVGCGRSTRYELREADPNCQGIVRCSRAIVRLLRSSASEARSRRTGESSRASGAGPDGEALKT